MTYKVREIEATQFDVNNEPSWPDGITATDSDPPQYIFTGTKGRQLIAPGDYIITSPGEPKWMSQEDFERTYEPV